MDVFNTLPIAALVAGKIFCVHGGLSPSMQSLDDVRNIMRPTDVPEYGLLNDLLWSDPSDQAIEWEDNERGVSYCFGKRIVNDFLARHDLDLVCRAHMVSYLVQGTLPGVLNTSYFRLLKMATSFSVDEHWSLSFQHPTIVVNLITLAPL